jgi:subtilisin family serine protease
MTPKAKTTVAILMAVLWAAVSIAYADIWIDPPSFNESTPEGTVLERTLTVGNDGGGVLNFMIRTRQVGTSMSGQGTAYSSIPAGHDFTQIAANTAYQPGRLIVRFARGGGGQMATMERRNQILKSLGGASVQREFELVPGLCVVELPTGMTVEEALRLYNGTDGIVYAEPDYEVTVDSTIPNDSLFNELWGMHNTGQSGGTVDADIDAPEAWDISTGSSDIIVAVIDTGIDYTHPDLTANMWVNAGEIPGNGQDDDGNGYIDDVYGYDFVNNDGNPMDDHYHGTHCAGTIGAVGNNSQGVAGVCWNVRIMAVKFLNSAGSGSTSNAILSVQYSTLMGANLSSNSWGGGGYSQGLKDAIDAAGAAGMLFVAAAGNDSGNNDTSPHYPSSYDSESLIAVMATDRYDSRSSFSNYGPTTVDLGAPGSEILSCKPGNQYQYLNGTSMATPHVAGACALLWAMNPAVSNLEIKNILIQTVDPTLSGQCVSGGRLNLYNAILEIKAPWIVIEPEEGTVGPGDSEDISVTFDALGLAPGVYEAEIVVISDAPSSPTIIPVTLTVTADDLQVAPAGDFDSSGTRGGPFTPKCMTYTLTNNGGDPVNWTTSETEAWLQVEPSAGVLGPSDSIGVDVCITSDANLLVPATYEQILTFENTNSGSIKQRLVTLTVKPPDCFTESFDAGNNDLDFLSLTFSPDGSSAYYEACRERVEEFPTDPNGGIYVPLGDDDFVEVVMWLPWRRILFYGERYNRFYIGSNGYITFGGGDTEYAASLENHFNMPRISGLFTDLAPLDEQCVSYKKLSDRVAVTFQGVPVYGDKTATNSFQIEMFYVDGTIRITWLKLAPATCVTGLSEGYGLPPQFIESDLSKYLPCWPECDLNRDYYVNLRDFAVFAGQWLEEDCTVPFWCGRADMDLSSKVDYGDLSICATNWLVADEWWLRPISHWKFDEGSGAIAYDSAGNNDGTLVNDPTWTIGQIGGALDFDGVNDYVNGSASPFDFSDTTFSVCAWFQTTANVGEVVISEGGGYSGWFLGVNQGKIQVLLKEESNALNAYNAFSINTYNNGQWHHVTAVVTTDTTDKSGNSAAIYVDGLPVSITETKTYPYDPSNETWKIGKRTDPVSCYFDGLVDDVRIYDRALSAGEIWQLYREGLGPKAFAPKPADGAATVDPNTALSWSPGNGALSHDVYLGTDYNDVNDANTFSPEYKGNQDVNNWDPCGLELDTTYYWRIDERNHSGTTKGDVWSFTTWVAPNLVSLWKFDEGSGTIAYDSAGNNDGTLVNGPVWTTGKINGALGFDGVDDYVDCGNDASLNIGTSGWTAIAWFKISDRTQYKGILGKWDGGGSNDSYRIVVYDGSLSGGVQDKVSFVIYDGSSRYWATSIKTVTDDNWHHVCGVRDSSGIRIYVDGVEENSKAMPSSANISNSTNLLVGKGYSGGWNFNGLIDDVRIYDRALSAGEIWQLYREGLGPKAFAPKPADGATGVDPNIVLSWSPGKGALSHDVYLGTDYSDVNDANTFSPEYKGNQDVNNWDPCGLELDTTYYWRIDEVNGPSIYKGDVWSFTTRAEFEPNLVSWWKFDEGSGSVAYDSAGDNDGTITGATWTTGQIDGALSFDGSSDYITVGDKSDLEQQAFTLTFWAKLNNPSRSLNGGIAKGYIFGSATEFSYTLDFHEGNARAGIINTSDAGFSITGLIVNSDWHMWTMTVGSGTLKLYKDGAFVNSVGYTGTIDYTKDNNNFVIGARDNGSYAFDGKIDDVRFYNRALSAGEILQLYQDGLNGENNIWGIKSNR